MCVVMHELAKGLDASNRAGQNVVASEYVPIDLNDRLPRRAGETAQETPIEPEKDSQPLRDRPDDLPMGDRLADVRCIYEEDAFRNYLTGALSTTS